MVFWISGNFRVVNRFCHFWVSEEKPLGGELPTARRRVLQSPISGFWLSCPAVMYTSQATRVTLGQFLCFLGSGENLIEGKDIGTG